MPAVERLKWTAKQLLQRKVSHRSHYHLQLVLATKRREGFYTVKRSLKFALLTGGNFWSCGELHKLKSISWNSSEQCSGTESHRKVWWWQCWPKVECNRWDNQKVERRSRVSTRRTHCRATWFTELKVELKVHQLPVFVIWWLLLSPPLLCYQNTIVEG